MKPSIQEQIEHYTNQVAIYLSYEYTDEPTLKFMIERLNKLVNVLQWYNFMLGTITTLIVLMDQIIKKKEGKYHVNLQI